MPKSQKSGSKKPPNAENGRPEVIPPPDDEVRPRQSVRHMSITHTQTWSAPFPPPEIMKRYDDVIPNGAARLFQIFEDETKHRREMERKSLYFQGRDLLIGKLFALIFALTVLGVAGFAIWMNAAWVATILGAGILGTIAATFFRIFGDNAKEKTSEPSPETKKPRG